MVYGNVKGIKKSVLDRLDALTGDHEKNLLIDREVLFDVADITEKINREICVFVTRSGRITAVGVGDGSSVNLEDVGRKRSDKRFQGVRCIHTHPRGSGKLSEMDTSALTSMRLDMMVAVGVMHGKPNDIEAAFINGKKVEKFYFKSLSVLNDAQLLAKIPEFEKKSVIPDIVENTPEKHTAILVNVNSSPEAEAETAELKRLADTMGLTVTDAIIQKQNPDKNFCAGKGKLEEIKRLVQIRSTEYVIFNNMLTGSQINNVEEFLGVKVIDRPMLILEIFAKHATSNEGKLQVQLAMMKYTLPKLLGQGKALSRIGGGGAGGVATKGSGETKLETDRRRIRRSIYELSERIEILKKERDLRRERRKKSGIKTVAIVGYTNAGKSTLMNLMTKAGVTAEDKLFATLDPVTRKIFVDIGKEYLLTDTVGFIDNLPHEFVDAFRSTLEEAVYADLILHVSDCSSPDLERQDKVVGDVLKSLGVADTPVIHVYNKADVNVRFATDIKDSVVISAKTGDGVEALKNLINEKLFG